MKCRSAWSAVWLLAAALLVSCAPLESVVDHRPRFREDAATDVILHHYRWEHINITRPEYREDGYLVTLTRDTLGPAFDRLRVKRDLAVVVFGWYYSEEQLVEIIDEWKALLRQHGFKRVVCVHGGSDKSVDGLPIISDTKQSDATPLHTANL